MLATPCKKIENKISFDIRIIQPPNVTLCWLVSCRFRDCVFAWKAGWVRWGRVASNVAEPLTSQELGEPVSTEETEARLRRGREGPNVGGASHQANRRGWGHPELRGSPEPPLPLGLEGWREERAGI